MTPPKRIGDLLREAGLIDETQINAALTEQKRWGGKLGQHLVRLGYVTEEAVLDVLRNQLKIPTVNLLKAKIPEDVLNLLPKDLCKKHGVLPVGVKKISNRDHLVLAMADPSNLLALDEIQFATTHKLLPALAGMITLDRAIRYYLDQQGDLFAETDDVKAFSPTSARDRLDITEGSTTFEGGELQYGGSAVPRPARAAPENESAGGQDALSVVQLRAEMTAIRDLLLEAGLVDRKALIERVAKARLKLQGPG